MLLSASYTKPVKRFCILIDATTSGDNEYPGNKETGVRTGSSYEPLLLAST
jgi:hypothetical protein